MRKNITIIIITMVVTSVFIGLFIGLSRIILGTNIDSKPSKIGDITIASQDPVRLLERTSLPLKSDQILNCIWYVQISDISSDCLLTIYDYFINGSITLKDDYYQNIITNYKWEKYDFSVQRAQIDESDFAISPMYHISIIRHSLEAEQLYVCNDSKFTDNGTFFTFLDKENKTLLFYRYDM